MNIKIYAPVDCNVKDISQSSDDAFSSKMLGEGIVFFPKKENFKSPFENAKVEMIFDTKHAIYFDVKGIKALMHIGLDTVKMNGSPFKIKTEQEKTVNLKSDIVSVDLKTIKDAGLSTETPIVFEADSTKKIKVTIIKAEAKQGELIAEISILPIENKKSKDKYEIKPFKNKYILTAERIFSLLGEPTNYGPVFNCMTRFRTEIKDKSKVNLEEITKIDIVKGTQFQGNQLQIIIGGEVVKVVDEFHKMQQNPSSIKEVNTPKQNLSKLNIGKRILTVITGVISPILGIFIAAGLFAGIYSILLETEVVAAIPDLMNIAEYDLFSGIMFVLFKFILSSIGLFFMLSTVKYFKGNIYFALAVGLAMLSRGWIPAIEGVPFEEAQFGSWISYGGKTGFLLFNIGELPIVVGSYEGGVLPFVAAATMIILLDRWIATWISPLVDTIFRGFLVIGITLFGTWFIFGPIFGLIEFGLLQLFILIQNIPYGIGVGLYAMLWQPLVLTGAHIAVSTPIDIALFQGVPQSLYPAYNIAIFSQMGAVIGVSLVAKNFTFKRVAVSSIMGGFFGVSEPMIYGVTLPKFRPFIIGCLVAFPIGILSGVLGLSLDTPGGWGIFEIVGYDSFQEKGLIVMIWVLSLIAGLIFTMLFYKERNDEYTYAHRAIKKLNKLFSFEDKNEAKLNQTKILEMFNNDLNEIKNSKTKYKNYEKYLSNLSKLEMHLLKIEQKENDYKENLFKKLEKIKAKLEKEKNDKLDNMFWTLNEKYNEYNLDNDKKEIKLKIEKLQKENFDLINDLEKFKTNTFNQIETKVNKISEIKNNPNKNSIINRIYNAVYTVEISYGILDSKPE